MQLTTVIRELYTVNEAVIKRIVLLLLVILSVLAGGCTVQNRQAAALDFDSRTSDGKPIDDKVFKDYTLTMVNVWTTWCSSCIKEMPDLQSVYEEFKPRGVNMLGIIADADNDRSVTLAQSIIDKNNVGFINILPDDRLSSGLLKDISTFPTTFFADSEGNMVGATLVGGNKEIYRNEILRILKRINDGD